MIKNILFDIGGPIDKEVLMDKLIDEQIINSLKFFDINISKEEYIETQNKLLIAFSKNLYKDIIWELTNKNYKLASIIEKQLYDTEKERNKKRGFFELNDVYFIIFSIPSIYCILNGLKYNNNIILSIGIGILFYGLIYIFLHDIFVHRRFSIVKKVNSPYLKKVRKAHLKHHSVKTKKGCTNFGFITY